MHRLFPALSLVALVFALAAVPGAATAATPTNVDISQRLGNESEEAIAVNPTNPNNIVVFTNVAHAEAGLTAGMLLAVAATFFDIEFQSYGTTGLLITAAGLRPLP